jgi:D-amino-acid dehydrogenase
MRVTIVGSGVIGITTAYFLGRDGHEVTVIDSNDGPASMASGANAGFLAPNDSFAWAAPSAPIDLLRSVFGADDTGLRVKGSADRSMLSWGLRFLRECTPSRARENSIEQLILAKYSQAVHEEVEVSEKLSYHVRREGAFYLFRDRDALNRAAAHRAVFSEHGVNQRVLDMEEVVDLEPALSRAKEIFAGGILGVGDAVGDSFGFCIDLARICVDRFGARFLYNSVTSDIIVRDGRAVAVRTRAGDVESDLIVVAAGVGSRGLVEPLGLRLPIFPVKGYSATFPILDQDRVPVRPAVEQTSLVAWSNLGDRFRMSCSAEVVGYDWTCPDERVERLRHLGREVFGDAVDFDAGTYRACLRPMTPKGPPLIGHTRVPGLFLNTGHGHLGWTWSCGSGRIAADLISGKTPELDSYGRTGRRPAWAARGAA